MNRSEYFCPTIKPVAPVAPGCSRGATHLRSAAVVKLQGFHLTCRMIFEQFFDMIKNWGLSMRRILCVGANQSRLRARRAVLDQNGYEAGCGLSSRAGDSAI